MRRDGYQRLWRWFGLSRASFLTLPRVLMHEMPDDWQLRMSALLEEYDATWDRRDLSDCKVLAVTDAGRFARWPDWLVNYRHPNAAQIEAIRARACEECGRLAHRCLCVQSAIDRAASGDRP